MHNHRTEHSGKYTKRLRSCNYEGAHKRNLADSNILDPSQARYIFYTRISSPRAIDAIEAISKKTTNTIHTIQLMEVNTL